MEDGTKIVQIKLPDPADTDPHPRLLVDGWGVHAGEGFTALFPDGWRQALAAGTFLHLALRTSALSACL